MNTNKIKKRGTLFSGREIRRLEDHLAAHPRASPADDIEDLARDFGRSVGSIKQKIRKMRAALRMEASNGNCLPSRQPPREEKEMIDTSVAIEVAEGVMTVSPSSHVCNIAPLETVIRPIQPPDTPMTASPSENSNIITALIGSTSSTCMSRTDPRVKYGLHYSARDLKCLEDHLKLYPESSTRAEYDRMAQTLGRTRGCIMEKLKSMRRNTRILASAAQSTTQASSATTDQNYNSGIPCSDMITSSGTPGVADSPSSLRTGSSSVTNDEPNTNCTPMKLIPKTTTIEAVYDYNSTSSEPSSPQPCCSKSLQNAEIKTDDPNAYHNKSMDMTADKDLNDRITRRMAISTDSPAHGMDSSVIKTPTKRKITAKVKAKTVEVTSTLTKSHSAKKAATKTHKVLHVYQTRSRPVWTPVEITEDLHA